MASSGGAAGADSRVAWRCTGGEGGVVVSDDARRGGHTRGLRFLNF